MAALASTFQSLHFYTMEVVHVILMGESHRASFGSFCFSVVVSCILWILYDVCCDATTNSICSFIVLSCGSDMIFIMHKTFFSQLLTQVEEF